MSRTYHHGERRIRVRGVKKDPPDLRRMARALIALARAEAEVQAEASDKKKPKEAKGSKRPNKPADTSKGPGRAPRNDDKDAA